MKALHQTSFFESLMIQKRVLYALIMREIITRYGRNNIGFLWLFVEPLLFTSMIVWLWNVRSFQSSSSSLNIIAFMITGYPMAMMWRNASNRAIGSIKANASLLYHRNVRVLDTILARIILEVSGATIAQVFLMAILVVMGWIAVPADPFYMILAWLLMVWFAFGLGMIICSIAFYIEVFGKLWGTFSFLLLPASGAFFFVHSLPYSFQRYALMIPMIHGTEMFRHGYYGNGMITLENPSYLIITNLVLTFIGLILVKTFSNGVEPR